MRIKFPFIVRKIQGHSMVPVLPPNTVVWGRTFFKNLKEGDIIVFIHEEKEKIKRIKEVNEDKIYVIGDHPETSKDSRHFGPIDLASVKAKIFWPNNKKVA